MTGMGDDFKIPARDALAIVTSLVPLYTLDDDIEAEQAWDAAQPMMKSILQEQSASSLITLIAHLANMAAHLAVQVDADDPYEVLQSIAKDIG